MHQIKPGDIVKHFKKDYCTDKEYVYKVLYIATDCDTEKQCVVYKEFYGDRIFVRDYQEFVSKISKKVYPLAKQEYRFEVIGHCSVF